MNEDGLEVDITGLNEDIIEFIHERSIYFEENKVKFYTSFFHSCSEIVQAGRDLSNKQLAIIYREYKKTLVKKFQKKLFQEENKN